VKVHGNSYLENLQCDKKTLQEKKQRLIVSAKIK
jgi:hypothetical protein